MAIMIIRADGENLTQGKPSILLFSGLLIKSALAARPSTERQYLGHRRATGGIQYQYSGIQWTS
jgi:hypothetical protein